jgi:hypothetical protein
MTARLKQPLSSIANSLVPLTFFFEVHPCGLHICYPKKVGEFGFIQTVKENMKLFSKRQIAGAT